MTPLSPDFAGRLDNEAQLGGLLIHRECIAFDSRRKTALRTQAELVERNEFGSFVDPALECLLALGGLSFMTDAVGNSHQP
jgi:hypothetical protein